MKRLKLVLRSIRETAFSQKLMYGVLITSLIFASLSLILFYGYIQHRVSNAKSNDARTLTYTVKLEKTNFQYDSCKNLFDEISTTFSPQLQSFRIKNSKIDLTGKYVIQNPGIYVTASLYDFKERSYVIKGSHLSVADSKNAANSACICNFNYQYEKQPDYKIKINDVEYKVTGVAGFTPDLTNATFIPFSTYVKNNIGFEEVNIMFSNVLGSKQKNELTALSKKYFPDSQMIYPIKTTDRIQTLFINSLLLVIFTCGLSLINALLLYRYLFMLRLPHYRVYRICGANKKQISFLLLSEVILTATITYAVGICIYYIILYFSDYLSQNLELDLCGTVLCYAVTIAIAMLSTTKTIYKILKKQNQESIKIN